VEKEIIRDADLGATLRVALRATLEVALINNANANQKAILDTINADRMTDLIDATESMIHSLSVVLILLAC
jgi:hypothetical protein